MSYIHVSGRITYAQFFRILWCVMRGRRITLSLDSDELVEALKSKAALEGKQNAHD